MLLVQSCVPKYFFSYTNIQMFTGLIALTFQIKSRRGSINLQILRPSLFLITPVPCDHSLTPASVQWVGNNPLHCLLDINFTWSWKITAQGGEGD